MLARFFGGGTPEAPDGASPKEKEDNGGNGPVETAQKDQAVTTRISKMDSIIRRKLHGTGAQYNMKVVIRGERGVGKSTLWRRLQGLPYEEKYIPTPEIQTTTINNWVYRGSQDVVKVEVWDVVDKGLARAGVGRVPEGEDFEDAVAGLPPESGSGRGGRSLAVLDAGVVNVYQGASAVIFMVDPYRPETLEKAEKGLAEAPVNLPTVVLLNFRDKLEEDAAAKARASSSPSERPALPAGSASTSPSSSPKQPRSKPATQETGRDSPRSGVGEEASSSAGVEGGGGPAGGAERGGDGRGGAWDHVVTLETARLMMDRVREADLAAGRGGGRRVSLFDCSMKNCFGLRVLYTYLNVPFLELKRQSLLQQAQIASERLEKEYQELAGFIDGHSYANYMQHLRTTDVDPTAGRSAPAAPPGRPSIASMPPADEASSLERRGSVDSGGGFSGARKEKKKKHHKDKEKDKSKRKDKHRHKSSKSRKDEREGEEAAAVEYRGRVTDAKDFAPVTKKTANEELADFLGESSEGESDAGLQERRKVVKAINRSALASANAAQADATDSDEMPAPRTSRLKRVTAPVKPTPTKIPARPSSRSTPPPATPTHNATATATGPKASNSRQQPVASAAASVKTTSSSTAKPPDPSGGASVELGGAGTAARRSPATSAAAEVTETGEKQKQKEEEEEEEEHGHEQGVQEEQDGAAATTGGEGGGEEEEDHAGKIQASSDEDCTAAAGGEGAAGSEGDSRPAAGDMTPPASAQAQAGSAEAVVVQGGHESEKEAPREVAVKNDSQAASQESTGGGDGGNDAVAARDEDQRQSSGGEDGVAAAAAAAAATDAMSDKGGEAEADTERAQEQTVPAPPVPSSPTEHTSPKAQRQQQQDVPPGDSEDVVLGVDRPAEAGTDPGPREGGVSPEMSTAVVPASADTADEQPGTGDVGEGGQEGETAAIDKKASPAAGVSEQGEADDTAPSSGAVAEVGADEGLRAGEEEEAGVVGSGGSVNGSVEEAGGEGGANADAGEEASEAAGGGANAVRYEAAGGREVVGEGALGGGVADDFFAGDSSSEEGELYPGAAAAASAAPAADEAAGSDQDPGPPAGEQPPSPRIIASSVGGGFRSPAAAQRKEAAAGVGEGGISEAAKATIAAALASASAASSTPRTEKNDEKGSKSRKKKKGHKERRRKRSGSKSAGEDDGRGSGSVGRSEGDEKARGKRSSSRRHHRKPVV